MILDTDIDPTDHEKNGDSTEYLNISPRGPRVGTTDDLLTIYDAHKANLSKRSRPKGIHIAEDVAKKIHLFWISPKKNSIRLIPTTQRTTLLLQMALMEMASYQSKEEKS